MKKNKMKGLLITLLALFTIGFNNVSAQDTGEWVSTDTITDVIYPDGNEIKHYTDSYLKVTHNGTPYDAYCPDWHKKMKDGTSVDCSSTNLTSSQKSALDYFFKNKNGTHWIDQLAIRYLAKQLNLGKTNSYDINIIFENNKNNANVQIAKNLANAALQHQGDSSTSGSGLTMQIQSENGRTFVIGVQSASQLSDIEFTCTNCTVEGKQWSGTSGTVTVTIAENKCNFTLHAYYNATGATLCKTTADDFQDLIIYVKETSDNGKISTTGSPSYSQTFKMSTSNSYYEEYCGENSRCQGKTEFSVPSLCDKNNTEEKITITPPDKTTKDVLFCPDDAGNTYQSNVVMNNHYCSVWCKESYDMTLPSAQYTTSGRYFVLSNTVVNVTRTCYAAGAEENAENLGIDIDKFIKDVIDKQKAMVNAYNNYKMYSKMQELVNNATRTDIASPCGKSNTIYSSYTSAAGTYDKYDIECNNQTGKCTVTPATGSIASQTWGITGATKSETTNADGTTTCNDVTAPTNPGQKPDYTTNINNAKTSAKQANEELGKMIDEMQQCYSWTNNLCLDPDITFDYNEQYSTDINYAKISEESSTGAPVYVGEKITANTKYDETSSGGTLETIDYLKCEITENANASTCQNTNTASNISTLIGHLYGRRITATGKATYNNKQEFKTNYPHGTIETLSDNDKSKIEQPFIYLGAVFPVALKTDTGVYKWTLDISRLGQYNDRDNFCSTSSLGRLDNVYQVQNGGSSLSADLQYVCFYVVDCDDCEYECVPPCTFPPECDDCDYECVNCIFNGYTKIDFKLKSLNNMNPNNDLAVNWTTEKGSTTVSDIEKKGEEAYEAPQYYFKLTPLNMKEIRDYNRTHGDYTISDVDYADVGGFENIESISHFVRSKESAYNSSSDACKGCFTEATRNTKWVVYSAATIPTIKDAIGNEIVDPNVESDKILGPAWKIERAN